MECWALQLVTYDITAMAAIVERLKRDKHFIGVHTTNDEGAVLFLFDAAYARNVAYTELNSGRELNPYVALILPPCYVDEAYMKQ